MTKPVPIIGALPGVEVGQWYANRTWLHAAGVHRMAMHGIAWSKDGPAESIVQSGGYEDDEDWGDTLLYTGMGGNAGGVQVAHQELSQGNLALVRSFEWRTPVRVIRGAKHVGTFSPASGLRYDGLFRVSDAFYERGRSGYRVWRFVLTRVGVADGEPMISPVQRQLIALYEGRCQVCGYPARARATSGAVPWHIVPLHVPHSGQDEQGNLLCLCPNHAAELTHGTLAIQPNLSLLGFSGNLRKHRRHVIDPEALRYRADRYSAWERR